MGWKDLWRTGYTIVNPAAAGGVGVDGLQKLYDDLKRDARHESARARLRTAGYGELMDLIAAGLSERAAMEAWREVRLDRQLGRALAEEEPRYSVVLNDYEGKIHAIKALRQTSGLGLREAKDAIERLPFKIGGDWSLDRAEEAKGILTQAGVFCQIEPSCSNSAAGD